jgi:hypothetical protein
MTETTCWPIPSTELEATQRHFEILRSNLRLRTSADDDIIGILRNDRDCMKWWNYSTSPCFWSMKVWQKFVGFKNSTGRFSENQQNNLGTILETFKMLINGLLEMWNTLLFWMSRGENESSSETWIIKLDSPRFLCLRGCFAVAMTDDIASKSSNLGSAGIQATTPPKFSSHNSFHSSLPIQNPHHPPQNSSN